MGFLNKEPNGPAKSQRDALRIQWSGKVTKGSPNKESNGPAKS